MDVDLFGRVSVDGYPCEDGCTRIDGADLVKYVSLTKYDR